MRLSIITINLNNQVGLRSTIESVSKQSFKDFEYIVIDGNSTDGSLDVISQYSIVSNWVSEPDKGIYDAQNKGAKLAKGDYLLFLNSGDRLIDENVLERLSVNLVDTDIIYGDLEIVEPTRRWVKKYSKPITFSYFLGDTLPHQASFISKKIFEKCGGCYDTTLRLGADWKFFLDAVCKHNATLKYVDEIVTAYDYTGISSVIENQEKMMIEKNKVLEMEYGRFYKDYDNIVAYRALARKYRIVTKARLVQIYFWFRNFFSAEKVNIP